MDRAKLTAGIHRCEECGAILDAYTGCLLTAGDSIDNWRCGFYGWEHHCEDRHHQAPPAQTVDIEPETNTATYH